MMMKIKKKYTKPSTRLIELGPDVAVLQAATVGGPNTETDPSIGEPEMSKQMNFDNSSWKPEW